MKKNLKIGQTIWLKQTGNLRKEYKPEAVTITSIRRKYFYVDNRQLRFRIVDLRQALPSWAQHEVMLSNPHLEAGKGDALSKLNRLRYL